MKIKELEAVKLQPLLRAIKEDVFENTLTSGWELMENSKSSYEFLQMNNEDKIEYALTHSEEYVQEVKEWSIEKFLKEYGDQYDDVVGDLREAGETLLNTLDDFIILSIKEYGEDYQEAIGKYQFKEEFSKLQPTIEKYCNYFNYQLFGCDLIKNSRFEHIKTTQKYHVFKPINEM